MSARWYRAAILGVPAAVAVLVAGCVATVPFVPDLMRFATFRAWPPVAVLVALAAFCTVAWTTRRCERRWPVHLVSAAILGAMHLAVQVQPLGDHKTWHDWRHHDVVCASELLANVLFRRLYAAFGPSAVDLVAPVCGGLFALAFLVFVERVCVRTQARAGRVRLLGAAVLAGSGWQLLFHRGYHENTQPSLALAVVGLTALAGYVRGRSGPAWPAAWLAFAALVHGANTPWLLALAPAAAWRHRGRSWRHVARDLAVAGAVVAILVGATVALVLATGHTIVAGHVGGGGDGKHFVPLDPNATASWYAFGMFDLAHLADVGNLYVLASPAVVAALVVLGSRRARRHVGARLLRQPVPAIAGSGAAVLVAIYYFDLLFPSDHDLMVCLGLPLVLLALQVLAAARGRLAFAAAVVFAGGAVLSWSTMASLLVDTPAPTTAAKLLVNGRGAVADCRPGEWVYVELVAPPNAAPPVFAQVYGWGGELPASFEAPSAALGMAFPRPGEPGGARAFPLLEDALRGRRWGDGRFDVRYVSQPIPRQLLLDGVRLQAVLTDSRGVVATTNTVQVVVRP